jgi:DNA-binding response OmpR family regulator
MAPDRRLVVVIEDEEPMATAVAARLRSEGFDVEVAGDGGRGIDLCDRLHPDLVVLDLMLPVVDGLEVCRRIQHDRHVPVIMLTARDGEADLLTGLAVGADDYLTKPFSPRELVARIHAVLRRADPAPAGGNGTVAIGAVTLDGASRRVRWNAEEIHLTPTEFDLLWCLGTAGGAVLSRDRLLAEVWGYRGGFGARTVDTHVRSLRRKLGDDIIRTVHGVGYAAGEVDG